MSVWIKEQVKEANKDGVIFGISGGIDSAVVAALSKNAMGDNVMGLIMPCGSHPEDEEIAIEFSEKFNIKTKTLDLSKVCDDFVTMNPEASKLAKANLKPRLRMVTLYYFANAMNYLVAGTGNKSELCVGYFTKYGDGGVDILPIGSLLKSEVRELANELGIPKRIIERAPSAGLWEGQTDETELGITYEQLDKIIVAIEKNDPKGIEPDILKKVQDMITSSRHKRSGIPIFKK
jgi:NAD+ synthase